MSYILITSLIAFALTFYFCNKNKIIVFIKRSLLPLSAIFFIAALIIFPKIAVASASKGIHLWLEVVFPSLFPFFVASQLLSKSGFIGFAGVIMEPVMRPVFNVPGSGSFALAMGIVSGYPMGASITSDLRKQELLSKTEAERLLTFTNNSGPLFIMGAVAVGMFKSPAAGYLLYLSHVAACLTVGMIFKYYKRSSGRTQKAHLRLSQKIRIEFQRLRNSAVNPYILFGECIKNSITTILAIGGFIIFFSVFINILIASGISGWICNTVPFLVNEIGLGPRVVEGIFCGIFEITTGSSMINASGANLIVKLCTASLIIGWAGFSVHAQVMSVISGTDISVKPYLAGKALQGIISCMYTFVGYNLFSSSIIKASSAFANTSGPYSVQWASLLKSSFQTISSISAIMLLVSALYLCALRLVSRKKLL
jgi:sporulation integral membrane protein YlbJ